MTRILLQYYHGYHLRMEEYNKGSAAYISTLIQIIRHYIPHAEFITFTQFSEEFALHYGFKVMDNKLFSLPNPFSLMESIKSTLLVARCFLWAEFHKYLRWNIHFLINDRYINEIVNSDLIINWAMDRYSTETGILSVFEHSKDMLIATFLGKPVMMWAVCFGPLDKKIISWLAKYTLNKINIITVREDTGLNNLRNIGPIKTQIYVTGDPVYLLEPVHKTRVKQILDEEGVTQSTKPLWGFCVSQDQPTGTRTPLLRRILGTFYYWLQYCLPTWLFIKLDKLATRFSIYSRLKGTSSSELFSSIPQSIDHITEKMNGRVIIIPHIVIPDDVKLYEKADDRELSNKLYTFVSNRKAVKVIRGNYTTEEIKGIIGQCDLFVSMRLHASVAAISQCIPTIPITYMAKFYGSMKMIGMEKWICNTTNPEELIPKIEELWAHREEIKNELKMRVEIEKKHALLNGELAKALIDKAKK